ncbi:tRNA (adenosine(37)-N6)-dimethylallyltransferase MiaA [Pelobacter seleniigenes]|uniref:tRNA (adenosine(37)-N6)-dimethylallyltransferase MiaA n=1 Tax=Pelobacter seleniigenes TaxID=407188 RepID=UPI00068EF3A4|nr:tRNA (adenosine(37)-N6)-dimethylallyltransferase MiaA [Pelobacter seleniigenes]
MTNTKFNLLVILGATAGGKTALAVRAASRFQGEIISADSRQVYRGMDLGTGKDLAEYGEIPYHLIDIAEPGSEYNLFRFQRECFAAVEAIWQRRRLPLVCGGTGLYLDAVLRGYRLIEVPENHLLRAELAALSDAELQHRLLQLKPEQHNVTDMLERARLIRAIEIAVGEQNAAEGLAAPPLAPLVFGLRWPREVLRKRIGERLRQRLKEGMVAEVQQLYEQGVPWPQLEFYGLEYRFIAQHLQGQMTYDEMVQKLSIAIGKFAKRQETFFRRMEKNGVVIHWLDGQEEPFEELCAIIARHQLLLPGDRAVAGVQHGE